MNTIAAHMLDREACLRSLVDFWQSETRIEETPRGLAVALPMLYPDGWQVVADLEQLTPHQAKLSDKGRTLGNLAEIGLIWDRGGSRNQALLDERLKAFDLCRDGFELFATARLPLQGVRLQLFGEALVSVAHLAYRIEANQIPQSAATAAVRRILEARKAAFEEKAIVVGTLERQIRVDYLIRKRRVMALEVVKRQGDMLPYMEQWGWRWTDIRNGNPDMLRAMVYDPDHQEWNETALRIGKSVCDIFCPYYDSDVLGDAIGLVA